MASGTRVSTSMPAAAFSSRCWRWSPSGSVCLETACPWRSACETILPWASTRLLPPAILELTTSVGTTAAHLSQTQAHAISSGQSSRMVSVCPCAFMCDGSLATLWGNVVSLRTDGSQRGASRWPKLAMGAWQTLTCPPMCAWLPRRR